MTLICNCNVSRAKPSESFIRRCFCISIATSYNNDTEIGQIIVAKQLSQLAKRRSLWSSSPWPSVNQIGCGVPKCHRRELGQAHGLGNPHPHNQSIQHKQWKLEPLGFSTCTMNCPICGWSFTLLGSRVSGYLCIQFLLLLWQGGNLSDLVFSR